MGLAGVIGLGHLINGYEQAAQQHLEQQIADTKNQRELQLGLVKELINSPNVPDEYKGALLQHGVDVANTPLSKKLPSFDKFVQSLPAVKGPQLQNPSQAPVAPALSAPGVAPSSDPATGTINPGVGPLSLPAVPIAMPSPPPAATISPAGQFHFLSQEDISNRDLTNRVNRAHELTSMGIPQIEAFQQVGLSPKPQYEKLGAGESLINPATGQVVAQSTAPSKAMESKPPYEVKIGPKGEIFGVTDNSGQRPKELTVEEARKIPEAKKLLDSAYQAADKAKQDEIEKENRLEQSRLSTMQQAFQLAMDRQDVQEARKQSAEARKIQQKAAGDLRTAQTQYTMAAKAAQDADLGKAVNDIALIGAGLGAASGTAGQKIRVTQTEWNQLVSTRPWLAGAQTRIEGGILTGAKLTPDQRNQIVTELENKVRTQQQNLNSINEQYKDVLSMPKQGNAILKNLKTPPPQDSQVGSFSVEAPNGKTYTFKDQRSLDNFKKAAGIQ